jgi:hypothetical protein
MQGVGGEGGINRKKEKTKVTFHTIIHHFLLWFETLGWGGVCEGGECALLF